MSDIIFASAFLALTVAFAAGCIWWAHRQMHPRDFERKPDRNKCYSLKPEVWKMLEDVDKSDRP